MKRILILTLILMLFCVAFADIDWASMDDATIQAELKNGQAELDKRNGSTEKDPNIRKGKATLFKSDEVTVTANEFEVSDYEYGIFVPALYVRYTVENNSDRDIEIRLEKVSINDWEVAHSGSIEIGAGHKEKGKFELKMKDAEVSTLSEIKKVTFAFCYQDKDGEYIHTQPKNIHFEK